MADKKAKTKVRRCQDCRTFAEPGSERCYWCNSRPRQEEPTHEPEPERPRGARIRIKR